MSTSPSNSAEGDWLALGQIFTDPFWFEQPTGGDPSYTSKGASLGVQILAAMDAGTQKFLHASPIPKTPAPFTAEEIMNFLNATFDRVGGLPRIGILLSPSVWKSSQEMLLDEQTDQRGEILQKMEIEIAPMLQKEKDLIVESLRRLKLVVAFEDE